jgi:hypothetical protein
VAPGKHPVSLVLDGNPSAADVDAHSPADRVVLIIGPRPSPLGPEPATCRDSNGFPCTKMHPQFLGRSYLPSLRAMLVGKTLLGMRLDDTFAALNLVCSQSYADCGSISAVASGPYGIVLLYAGLLDRRFSHITVNRALSSYRSVVDTKLHRNVAESILPGALLHLDLPDIVAALGNRVSITNPLSADGEVVPQASKEKRNDSHL